LNIQLKNEHPWDIAPYEAQQLQKDLQAHVHEVEGPAELRTIAGVEIGHSRFSDVLTVAVAVVSYPEMTLIEEVCVEYQTKFPYIPGLLSFREAPAILKALERLKTQPDLLMIDGPGIAHPHGLGIASHLGVLLDLPTIGCSRSSLVGSYVEPEVSAGSQTSLVWQGEIIGTVYRSKNRVAPLFVSVGHKITRARANELVIECCQGYRLPEPTRHAYAALTSARASAKGAPETVATEAL
jgi:deoxyribonuclease V